MIIIIISLLNIGPMSFQYRLTTSILFITKYHNCYTSQTYLSKKNNYMCFFIIPCINVYNVLYIVLRCRTDIHGISVNLHSNKSQYLIIKSKVFIEYVKMIEICIHFLILFEIFEYTFKNVKTVFRHNVGPISMTVDQMTYLVTVLKPPAMASALALI